MTRATKPVFTAYDAVTALWIVAFPILATAPVVLLAWSSP
jgi:hypothetical protein